MTTFQGICTDFERDSLKNHHKKSKQGSKAVNNMAEQLVKPPARVWEKIQAALDEQDNRRNDANKMIMGSFDLNSPDLKRKKVY